MFKKSKEEMQKLWNSVLINVEKKLNNPRAFEIWIKPVLLREIEDKTLKLELPAVTFEKGFIPFLGMIKEEFYILEQWYPEVELVYREEQSTPKKVESEL